MNAPLPIRPARLRRVVVALLLLSSALLCAPSSRAASVRLFDGRSLAGWEGDTNQWWRVEDHCLVGGSLTRQVPANQFLATLRSYTNFILKAEFKLIGTNGFINSGIQIRSQRVPNDTEMSGYQCDIGDPTWWGCVYDESRRNKVLAQSDMKAVNAVLKRGEWNHYEIRAEGPRIRTFINDVLAADYIETDPKIPLWGHLGLQIHGGGRAEAWFRKLTLRELPATSK